MKVLITFMWIFSSLSPAVFGQTDETSNQTIDQIIDGRKVMIELFKALKSNKKRRNRFTSELCLQNTSDIPVKVKLENIEEDGSPSFI